MLAAAVVSLATAVVSLAANGEATRRRSFLPVLIVVVSPESSAE